LFAVETLEYSKPTRSILMPAHLLDTAPILLAVTIGNTVVWNNNGVVKLKALYGKNRLALVCSEAD